MKVKVKLIKNKKNFRTFMLHKICKETKKIRENTEVIKKNTEPDKDIPMSAFFPLTLITTLFMSICIILALMIIYGLYDLYKTHNVNILFIITTGIIFFTSSIIVLLYEKLYNKFPKVCKYTITGLVFFILLILMILLLISVNEEQKIIYNKFIICFILTIMECLFISIIKSFKEENDKNYVVGYFSAITSLVALIISIIALIG